ncbi:hypothetical protein [Stenotrophomonas sp.]|uniref:hypothetical protein n=1 Tax=Stenotrophomonas sp. TaxID=69392 RepID=UPI00289A1A39|nr:hypothetical protein [Stenotrophomonas sp.]
MDILIGIVVVLVLLVPVAALFLWLLSVICYALCEVAEGSATKTRSDTMQGNPHERW